MMNTQSLIEQASRWSNYLRHQLQNNDALAVRLAQDIQTPLSPERIHAWMSELDLHLDPTQPVLSSDALKPKLRQLRKRIFLCLATRDINQLATLEEVVGSMSYLADVAVMLAYRSVMAELVANHGVPTDSQTGLPLEMIVLGMGKLGGRELNVSSDIDLIMLYAEEGETQGRRPLSYHEFYARLTQRMMPIISEITSDGFVFRTDLRLRPDGDGSPLAWSLDALENYLITQGRDWERYAWLKARCIPVRAFADSEPLTAIQILKSIQRPFVFRKYFDFDALSALRKLREQIRQEWQRKVNKQQTIDSQHNVKLGQGGIREIEFIAQLSQLIRGGRQPQLRNPNLLATLKTEHEMGILNEQDYTQLEQAYRFLRRVEHLIQYQNDAQTHLLPTDPTQLDTLAQTFSLSQADFLQTLDTHRQHVHRLFKNAFRLVGINEEEGDSDTEEQRDMQAWVENLFKPEEREGIENQLTAFYNHAKIKTISPTVRKRLDKVIPLVLKASAQTGQPVQTCGHLLDLIQTIAQRSAYIALLDEYPETVNRIARMMSAAPWAASYITANPFLLDGFIKWSALLEPVNIPDIVHELAQALDSALLPDGSPDVELQMNLMREKHKEVVFQLLAQDLEGILSVETLADQLSLLADLLLQESLHRVWPLVRQRFDNAPEQPKFAIIAYGRLGGKELGYVSDLDVVFLFDDPWDNAVEAYTRLARRLTTWLSSMTSSGRLYEIDTRLRPDGDAGLLAVSVDSFKKYQETQAWPWEHQALTRARFAVGDPAIGQQFEAIRASILVRERDPKTFKLEIINMRQKIHDGHPNKTDLFDIKHSSGGMVDIEFITQYMVLMYSKDDPELLKNWGNIKLLNIMGDKGFLPKDKAHAAADIYRKYRKMQHAERLLGHDKARIDPDKVKEERTVIKQLWESIFGPSTF